VRANYSSELTAYQVRQALGPGIKRHNATLVIKSISKQGLMTMKVLAPSLADTIAPKIKDALLQVYWLK